MLSAGKTGPAAGRSQARALLPLDVFRRRPIEAAVSNKAFGFVVPPEREGSVGYGTFDRVMNVLEHAVSTGSYLVGDSFTAADLYVGSQIGFGLMFGTIESVRRSPTIGNGSAAAPLMRGPMSLITP